MACSAIPAGPRSVAVWEYLRFSGTWLPYPAEVCEQFEKTLGQPGGTVVFVNAPGIKPHSVDVVGMRQIFAEDQGSSAAGSTVRRMLYPPDSAPAQGVSWQWLANNKVTWYTYSTPLVCLIEKLRLQGWSQVNLQNYYPECIYTLDFSAMVQRNNFSGFSRSVRRLDGLRRYPPSCEDAPPAAERYPESCVADVLRQAGRAHGPASQASQDQKVPQNTPSTQRQPRTRRKRLAEAAPAELPIKTGPAEGPPGGSEEFLSAHTLDVGDPVPEEDCSICREPLCQPSAYAGSGRVVRLRRCSHPLHHACLVAMCQSSPQAGHLQCPVCKALHGVKSGNQPPGHMSCTLLPVSLPGYEGCGTIRVNYHISPGIQGPEHPHPGRPYTARGFPRRGYLPDNDQGRQALALLATAWDRRLMFTVGQSTTTGEEDTVTWNEIHQKTQMHGGAHGYPDPSYLDRLLAELADHGVLPPDTPAGARPPPPPQQSLLVPKQEPLSPPKQE